METEVNAATRMGAMMLDHMVMSFIVLMVNIPGVVLNLAQEMEVTHEFTGDGIFNHWSYIGLLGFAIYLSKDAFNGRSIAKRILKIQVVDNRTGEVASPIQCLVRNVFCVFWLLEVIVTLASPARRIGDRVAGTRVVWYHPEEEQPGIGFWQVLFAVGLAYGALLLLTIPLDSITSKASAERAAVIETSVNAEASAALQ